MDRLCSAYRHTLPLHLPASSTLRVPAFTRAPHVSSPTNASRCPRDRSWYKRLSSWASVAERLSPISTKVGKPPVMRAFTRCMVVVGGSATNLNALDG